MGEGATGFINFGLKKCIFYLIDVPNNYLQPQLPLSYVEPSTFGAWRTHRLSFENRANSPKNAGEALNPIECKAQEWIHVVGNRLSWYSAVLERCQRGRESNKWLYLEDTKVKSCPVYIWEDYWLLYYLLQYSITTLGIPILWRIPVTFTKRVVQENLGWVVPRFKSKEHDLICSIIMVYNHRRKGCWSLSDMYSPWIPSSSLDNSIVSHGLNEETAEFPWGWKRPRKTTITNLTSLLWGCMLSWEFLGQGTTRKDQNSKTVFKSR